MKKAFLCALTAFTLLLSVTGCKKSDNLNTDNRDNSGPHHVDQQLVGKWMWTSGSSTAFFDDNGVYNGPAYGFALQFTINADGSGTCYDHIFSTLGAGSTIEANIYYKGFFESDGNGQLGFYPTGGTYQSTSTPKRALRADELWDTQTKSGRSFIEKDVVVTTQGGRACFQTTESDGSIERFYKIP